MFLKKKLKYRNDRVKNVRIDNGFNVVVWSKRHALNSNNEKDIYSKIWTSVFNDIVSDGNKVYQSRFASSTDILLCITLNQIRGESKTPFFIQILSQIKS